MYLKIFLKVRDIAYTLLKVKCVMCLNGNNDNKNTVLVPLFLSMNSNMLYFVKVNIYPIMIIFTC